MDTKDNINDKLNELLKTELFKENNFIKIYKLLNIPPTPPGAPPAPTPTPVSPSTPPTPPGAPPATPPTPPGAPPAAEILDNVKVIFVRVKFNTDNTKIFIINKTHKIDEKIINTLFKSLNKDDLYNNEDNYVKYIEIDNNKYIICIEPDFTKDNDDPTELVNDLFDILTKIYNSIIKIFTKEYKINKKLILQLSIPSIIDDDVSNINKKTILGCFSKIYKENYNKYDILFDDEELSSYFIDLIKK
jgi:hypothetical protein